MRKTIASILLLFALAGTGLCAEAPPPVGPPEAKALFDIVRDTPSPDAPTVLDQQLDLPVVLTLYSRGSPIQRAGTGPTLRDATREAADALLALMDVIPGGRERFDQSRLAIEIVLRREPLEDVSPMTLPGKLRPGLDGLAVVTEEKTVFLPPLLLLRHWHAMDVAGAAYAALESRPLPADARMEKIQTAAFIETSPGETALPLFRGNVLIDDISADKITQAVFRAGLGLLRTQDENGEFPAVWAPGPVTPLSADPALDQLLALRALALLEQLSGDKRFREAADRTIRNLTRLDPPRLVANEGVLYVSGVSDDVTGSALLLTALCQRAMIEGFPVADRRMIMLGDFLVRMTGDNGRMVARLKDRPEGGAPRLVRGLPYAETLLALALLQRISPSPERAEVAAKIAGLLADPPPDLSMRDGLRDIARTVEALGEYYKLTRSDHHAEIALRLADEMVSRQEKESGEFPDYAGGFAEADMPPATGTTAAVTAALASAYELRLLMRRPTGDLPEPIHRAAVFLINMQYRRENSFFLPEDSPAHGAFREGPVSLNARLADTAEAVRALIGATIVTAENRPSTPPAAPAE
jgi:hypothetical protein